MIFTFTPLRYALLSLREASASIVGAHYRDGGYGVLMPTGTASLATSSHAYKLRAARIFGRINGESRSHRRRTTATGPATAFRTPTRRESRRIRTADPNPLLGILGFILARRFIRAAARLPPCPLARSAFLPRAAHVRS